MVKALILRSAGTNCNEELEAGFRMAGAQTEQVHINQLVSGEKKLEDFDILGLPGGFSYGDYISAGSILANQLSIKLKTDIENFIARGKIVVGICNGFQALVRTGFLPGEGMKATLTNNDSGRFECRWVTIKRANGSPFTKGMEEVAVPIAHGEGKFVADEATLKQLEENKQILFTYKENPNGSLKSIAGITNKQGNVIGMMPHPERHLTCQNHPAWHRKGCSTETGQGLQFFKNIVEVLQQ